MSKSGLYAHFGSKRDLQLATIESARATFVSEVLRPGLAAPKGVRRLMAACEAFLSHVKRRVFPGGCFFAAAAAEVGTRRGPVRDAVAEQQRDWLELLERLSKEADELGELPLGTDPARLAFELNALLVAANTAFVLQRDPRTLGRVRTMIGERLGLVGGDEPRRPDARR
jgi:AcrR family transcriptional regulator